MSDPSQLTPKLGGIIFGLEASDYYDAIDQMANMLSDSLGASDAMRISAAAIARESLACTYIGKQTAIPHARLPNMDSFLVGLGFTAAPLLWGPDQAPVRLVMLSVVPAAANMAYLGFMRSLMQALKDDAHAQALIHCDDETKARAWLAQHLHLK